MIELQSATVSYAHNGDDAIKALDSVNLNVATGEWLTILGSNGSGKSTLLKLVAGMILPSSGRLFLNGTDVSAVPQHRRARRIQFIEQDSVYNVVASMTVEENLLLSFSGSALAMARKPDSTGKIRELLSRFEMGLENRLGTQVRFLSGGQRQALAAARAVLGSAQVMLLDEFTASLDPKAAPQLLAIVRKLAGELKLTVLMVSHDLEEAASLGERTIFLNSGRIRAELRPPQISKDALLSLFTSVLVS